MAGRKAPRWTIFLAGASMTGLGLAGVALAEEAPPPRLSFDLGASVSQSSNPDLLASGGAATTDAGLSFGLSAASDTRDQKFRLHLGTTLQDGSGIDAPVLDLSYARQGASSAFQLSASHSEAEVGDEDALTATGRVTASRLSLGLQTGTQGPFATSLQAEAQARDYSQNSTTVHDTTSQSLSAAATLRGVAGGDLSLSLARSATQIEDPLQTRRQSQSLSLGQTWAVDGATKLTASLGQTRAETRKLGFLFAQSSGLTGSLSLQRDLGNGTASLGLALSRDAQGARQAVRASREVTFATSSLSAEFGLSARPGESASALGRLTFAQELAADKLSVSLSRDVAVNEDEADTLQSALKAEWSHKLGEGMTLGLTYGLNAETGVASGTVDDTLRQSLTASYGQALTRDWALRAGLTLTQVDRDSTGRAEDQTLFLSISRSFVLLP